MKMLIRTAMLVLALCATAQAQSTQAMATRPARPTTAIPAGSCVTAQCHAQVKSARVLHGPVNVDACDTCHKVKDVAAHTFEPTRKGAELCTFCHQINLSGATVVHKPVAEGQCISCHNPHGGKTKAMTRGNTMRDLCNTCHKDMTLDKKFIHGPVAAGACESCHSSHTAKFSKLLNAQGNQLCFDCHRDMRTQMANAKFKHKAVEGNCADCHDPHASSFTMQTKEAPYPLCTRCHEKVKDIATTSTYKHSVVTGEQACLICHTAHGGSMASLMRKEPANICITCHAKPITTDSRRINSVAEIMDPKKVKHGPIRDGQCSGCHQTHGSNLQFLLANEYPSSFYQSFDIGKYSLCFSCHDKQLVLAKDAKNLTNFRNGEENLHFVHVNREKGRNCRSCHNTHASPNELHVRDSVPYGNWELPVTFAKSATGGSCAPGCHQPFTYDRETPVTYEPKEQRKNAEDK